MMVRSTSVIGIGSEHDRSGQVFELGGAVPVAAGGLLVTAGTALASATLVLAGPIVAVVGVLEVARRRRARVDRELTEALVELIETVVLTLRSGATLLAALASAQQASGTDGVTARIVEDWLTPISAASPRGLTSRSAVQALLVDPRTLTDDRLRLIAATLNALVGQGGPAIPAMQRLRFSLSGIGQAVDDAEAQAGQAKASSALMVAAPFVFALVLGAVDRSARTLYLHSTSGMACLLVAGLLSYGGWCWMSTAMRRVVLAPTSTARKRRPFRGITDDHDDKRGLIIELVSVVLAGGGTVREAVAFVADHGPQPHREAFQEVLDRAAGGELLADALPQVSARLGSTYRSLVAALILSDQGGAAIALTLSQLSDEADAARRRQLELRAKRLSVSLLMPLLLCSLPALIVGAVVPLIIVALGHLNA